MDDVKASSQTQSAHHVVQCPNIGDINVYVQVLLTDTCAATLRVSKKFITRTHVSDLEKALWTPAFTLKVRSSVAVRSTASENVQKINHSIVPT